MPGAVRGGRCGASRDGGLCLASPATWYSAPNRIFVCEACGVRHNDGLAPGALIARSAVDADRPAVDLGKLRVAAAAALERQRCEAEVKSEEELVQEIIRAAAELDALRRGGTKPSIDALVDRFRVDD